MRLRYFPRAARGAIVLGMWAGYVLTFFLLYPQQGGGTAALVVFPVVVVGWLWGAWAGLLAGLLSLPLNTVLLNAVGYQPGGWFAILGGGGGVGSVAVLLIGLVVGRMSDLGKRAQRELAERQQAEARWRESEELYKQAEALQEAVYRISEAADQAMNPDQLFRSVHAIIGQVMPAQNFYIALYDSQNDLISYPYFVDEVDGASPSPPAKPGKGMTEYVLRTGKPVLCDMALFEELRSQGEVELIGALSPIWLGVPLMVEERILGVMAVQDYVDAQAYGLREQRMLEYVSARVAQAIEHQQAQAALRQAEERFRALIENSSDAVSLLDLNGTIIYASPSTSNVLGYAGEELVGRDVFELIHPEDRQTTVSIFAELVPRAGAQATAQVRYRHKDGSWRWIEGVGKNLLAEPAVQAIVVNYRDITDRNRAEGERAHRLAELEAVNRISTALRAAQTIDQMLPRLLDETLAAMGSQVGAIWLYDASNGELRVAVARGWFSQLDETPTQPGEGIGGAVFATGEVYLSHEFAADPQARELSRSQIPREWGGACIPIRTAAETVGVFYLAVPLPRELQPEEVHLLTTLAEIAGNAIHRMRLHAQAERHVQRLNALRIIDMAITASLDLRVTLNVLLDQVINQLRVDAASVLLLNPRSQTLEHAADRGFRTRFVAQTRLRLGEGYAGRAALERRTIAVPYLSRATGDLSRALLLGGENFQAYHGVPLIAKGQIKGVLEVFHRASFTPEPDWQDFLETLAGQAAIALDDAELFARLQRSNAELVVAYDATIEGWSRALDLRDKETEGHTQRVAEMTLGLARALGVGEDELVHIRRGALLHDIGKMGIPDHILLKPGPLTDEEWAVMRLHPGYAYQMLAPVTYLRPALDIPYCHHEKWDGTGYPRGLKGEQIPLAARIFAVADVWDALCSDRPYRPGWPEEKVRAHIREQVGKHFDPRVVEVFLEQRSADQTESSTSLRK